MPSIQNVLYWSDGKENAYRNKKEKEAGLRSGYNVKLQYKEWGHRHVHSRYEQAIIRVFLRTPSSGRPSTSCLWSLTDHPAVASPWHQGHGQLKMIKWHKWMVIEPSFYLRCNWMLNSKLSYEKKNYQKDLFIKHDVTIVWLLIFKNISFTNNISITQRER